MNQIISSLFSIIINETKASVHNKKYEIVEYGVDHGLSYLFVINSPIWSRRHDATRYNLIRVGGKRNNKIKHNNHQKQRDWVHGFGNRLTAFDSIHIHSSIEPHRSRRPTQSNRRRTPCINLRLSLSLSLYFSLARVECRWTSNDVDIIRNNCNQI